MEIPARKVRLDDEVWERIQALPGKTPNEKLRGLLFGEDTRLDELVELARSLPAEIETIVDGVMQRKIDERQSNRSAPAQSYDPRAVSGVQTGAHDLRPRRESGSERAERERRARQERVAAMDSVDDLDIDRSDEFVSQSV